MLESQFLLTLTRARGGVTPWTNPKLTLRDEYLQATRVANYPNARQWTVGGSRREPQGRHWENEQGPHRNVQ